MKPTVWYPKDAQAALELFDQIADDLVRRFDTAMLTASPDVDVDFDALDDAQAAARVAILEERERLRSVLARAFGTPV